MKKVIVNIKDSYSTRDSFQEAYVEDDGSIKWVSNGRYLMEDTMRNIIRNGFTEFSIENTLKKRDVQVSESISRMRRNTINDEIMAEMEANFKKGTTVVNILTGEQVVV